MTAPQTFASLFPGFPSAGLVVLIGVSGSGKSSWAKRALPHAHVLSSDAMRAVLTDDESHQDCSHDAFELLERLADLRLKYGRTAVLDATNLKRSARTPWLAIARKHHVPAVAVWFDVPLPLCARRQFLRDRKVPPEVLGKQAKSLNDIRNNLLEEGWDAVVRLSTEQERPEAYDVEVLKPWSPPTVSQVDDCGVQVSRRHMDIIGDVHGCLDELTELAAKLGYRLDPQRGWSHPDNRLMVFIGDLTDRGPDSLGVLDLAEKTVKAGHGLLILGNHDDKLKRWLKGHHVKPAHGLETTIAEYAALDPQNAAKRKAQHAAFLEGAPHWAFADPDPEHPFGARLVMAHAAWKPSLRGADAGKVRAFCLYGPTTGTLINGMPQRLDWKKRYPAAAPTCVVGHTPFLGQILNTHNTYCVDTACVFGGRLSAMRWPEREFVSVPAKRAYSPKEGLEDQPNLIDPDRLDEAAQAKHLTPHEAAPMSVEPTTPTPLWATETIGPEAPFDLRIDHLFAQLRDEPERLLRAVDTDPKLLRRSPRDPDTQPLVLANASKLLFTPDAVHHLFAKGLVYVAGSWQVASVPYLKMYNYGERKDAADLSNALAGRADVQMRFLEKIDGSMIQTFSTAGLGLGAPRVILTTRGMIESADPAYADGAGFDYLGTARRLLEQNTPLALDPARTQGLTLLWEFIHPQARIVTDYGERQAVILTGVVSLREPQGPRYLSRAEVEALAADLGAPLVPELRFEATTLAGRIEELARTLDGTDQEGTVITFEGPDEHGRPCVLHRVKVKSPSYLRLMRLFAYCTFERTRESLEANPDLTTWDKFKTFLQTQGSHEVPEEVLSGYRAHFEAWHHYLSLCEAFAQEALRRFHLWLAAHPEPTREPDPAPYKAWRRDLAFWAKQGYADHAWIIFMSLDGRMTVDELRRKFKDELLAAQEGLDALRALPDPAV